MLDYTKTNSVIIPLKGLYTVSYTEKLCRLPYPGHPKGCPNVGKSQNCPPFATKLGDKYNFDKPYYFVVQPFDIAAQKEKMRRLHPDWSAAQCACCLYWQNIVRKKLNKACNDLRSKIGLSDYDYELIPEAMGLDVFKTALAHNIPIERNPQKMIYKIAFVGFLK